MKSFDIPVFLDNLKCKSFKNCNLSFSHSKNMKMKKGIKVYRDLGLNSCLSYLFTHKTQKSYVRITVFVQAKSKTFHVVKKRVS